MKIEWSPEDIKPARIVGRPDKLERWMIGYINGSTNEGNWVLVSLSDGMVTDAGTAKQLATKLNDAGELPLEFFENQMAKRGRSGGHARAVKLSPERRSKIASDAANARWNNAQ